MCVSAAQHRPYQTDDSLADTRTRKCRSMSPSRRWSTGKPSDDSRSLQVVDGEILLETYNSGVPIGDQHVVSRFLLKRWSDSGGLLISHRIDNGYVRRVGPAGVGRIDSFVQLDLSDPVERRWADIESRAGDAIQRAVEAAEPAEGDVADALKDLLALHLLRSRDSTERWALSITSNERIRQLLEWLDEPGVLENLALARTGIHAAGPELLEAEKDFQLARLERELGMGGVGFVESTLTNLDQVRTRFASYAVQIGWSESDAPFLIGDTPAVVVDTDSGSIGFRNGVTLKSCNQVLMPIGPHHTLSLGTEPAWVHLPAGLVSELNSLQLWNSRVVAMYGTDSQLGSWVDGWRQAHVHPDDLGRTRRDDRRRR